MKNLFLKSFTILVFCAIRTTAATEISPILGVGTDIFAFTIEELGASTKPIEYEPNIPGLTRLGVSAYGYGVSYGIRADVKELDPLKGQSEFTDFQFGYHNMNWGAVVFVQNYKGFYIKNSDQFSSPTPYFLFPDLKWTHYGLMGRYAMDNQGFSVSALTTQSEQIKKTAGSYFLVGGYRYHSLDSDSSLIPTTLQGINVDMDQLRKLKAHSLNLGLGAGKYWVNSSHFFIGGVFDLLGTYALYDYENTTAPTSSSYGTLSYNFKIGTGYSGEHFRTGFSVVGEVTTLKSFNASFVKPSASQLLLYFRYAF